MLFKSFHRFIRLHLKTIPQINPRYLSPFNHSNSLEFLLKRDAHNISQVLSNLHASKLQIQSVPHETAVSSPSSLFIQRERKGSYQSSESTKTQIILWSFPSLSTVEGNDTLP